MYFMKTVTTSTCKKKDPRYKKNHIFLDFNKSYANNSCLTIDLSFIIGIKMGPTTVQAHITHGMCMSYLMREGLEWPHVNCYTRKYLNVWVSIVWNNHL